ncbi:MAG: PHP domain-containing protein [Lentisphaeria bacterium]|nr:PHP domain-containing protein [Lentisphaeria bacterium]
MTKIELHTHSTGFSKCGKLDLPELLSLYKAKAYDVMVLTNHFNNYSLRYYTEAGGKNYHRDYHETIRRAQKIGEEMGILVLGAYELRFDENANDYLVFGMTEEFTKEYETIFASGVKEFSQQARTNGFLLYQAHPFRDKMTVTDPSLLFGIETKNTHPRHDNRNDICRQWAEKFGLHGIGGSDCHQAVDAGGGGILTERNVKNMDDLVSLLREDDYTIL